MSAAARPAAASASTRAVIDGGTAIPVVSANENAVAPTASRRRVSSTVLEGSILPSYGQPKAVAMMTSTGMRASSASAMTASIWATESSWDCLRLRVLWVSDTLSTTSSSSASASRASRAPWRFGTRTR